jgi:chemotaxis protein histidine kinase CheA
MSSSDNYRRRAQQIQREIEQTTRKRANLEEKAAKADAAAARAEAAATKASSANSAATKRREVERERKKATAARTSAASESKNLARLQKKLNEAEGNATKAEGRERAAEARKQQIKEQQEAQRRRMEERRRREAARAAEAAQEREVSTLSERTEALEEEIREAQLAAPTEITVLLVAGTIEGGSEPLRLDREVNEIQRRIRESKHRDAIRFVSRHAVKVTELMQALNEEEPDVVHFSGHGSQDALLFEGNDGQPLALSNENLSLLLQAAPRPIRLAVFNACESSIQAALACDFVDAAIGMDASVADASAKEFAGQLYNSIGFGHDLNLAFTQAKAQASLAGTLTGEPRLYTAENVSAEQLVLVAPAESSSG